jgi:hypothetical protein
MATYEDRTERCPDHPEITCSTLPFGLHPWDEYNPAHFDVQMQTGNEIVKQYTRILEHLVETKSDPLEIVRLWIRTEKLLIEYTSEGFNELLPFQAGLRMHIDRATRVLRRVVIRNALKAPKELHDFCRTGCCNRPGPDHCSLLLGGMLLLLG